MRPHTPWPLLALLATTALAFDLPIASAGAPYGLAADRAIALGDASPGITARAWLPICLTGSGCQPVVGVSYADTPAGGYPAGDPPAAEHPDLNLAWRGWERNTGAYLGLVDYSGSTDSMAPQLLGLFADRRVPAIVAAYRVYDWNWAADRRGALLTPYPATLIGLRATRGETVHVPASGYTIGDTAGFEVLVLYADEDSVTLKYTRDDNVVRGYTLHLEGLCVEPRLLALYERNNAAGRSRLPGLVEYQALGRARDKEVLVAIRDNGTFMDPRSRKDWWQGVSAASEAIESDRTIRHDVVGPR
ncbi:MAG: hypothetical protein ACOX3S_10440 [Anaerolineae bacterium]|jgi:hypothetical protein